LPETVAFFRDLGPSAYERFGLVQPDGARFRLRRWIELQQAFLGDPEFPGSVWALGTVPDDVETVITTQVAADCYQCGYCPYGITYFCGPGCRPTDYSRAQPPPNEYDRHPRAEEYYIAPTLIPVAPRPDESPRGGSGGAGDGRDGRGDGSGSGDGSGPASQPGA
jgi:hypothetical protein